MRPIKYRGFQKSWIYGGVSIFNGEATIYDESCVANSAYDVDIKSVGEFTGLKDKNGTEIYEGDIIEIIHEESKNDVAQVLYKDGAFGYDLKNFVIFHLMKSMKYFQVIGNIYENPELLS